jgi:hypothetical protein
MTTNDPENMVEQTAEAVRESVAPLADTVVRNAIGAELRRAYDNAMDDLQVLAAEHGDTWKAPEPMRLGQVVRPEIEGGN